MTRLCRFGYGLYLFKVTDYIRGAFWFLEIQTTFLAIYHPFPHFLRYWFPSLGPFFLFLPRGSPPWTFTTYNKCTFFLKAHLIPQSLFNVLPYNLLLIILSLLRNSQKGFHHISTIHPYYTSWPDNKHHCILNAPLLKSPMCIFITRTFSYFCSAIYKCQSSSTNIISLSHMGTIIDRYCHFPIIKETETLIG